VIGTVNNSNYAGGATNTLVIAKARGTVTLSDLTQTATGSAIVVQASTVPAGLAVSITYNGSAQAPTKSGTYTVVGTIVNSNYTGSVTNTLTVKAAGRNGSGDAAGAVVGSPAQATITLSNLTASYTGQAQGVGVTTSPAGLPVMVTYNGATNAPTNAGTYAVTATVTATNYEGTADGTLTITQALAQLMFYSLNQIYDGTPKAVGIATAPSGLTVEVTYNTSGIPVSPGAYTAVAKIVDTNYTGTGTNTLTVYDPTNALVLSWPITTTNTAIFMSTNLTGWSAVGGNIGPTNQLIVPKLPGNEFFQGINLQIMDPAR
jgi:hypothetical protein